MTKTLFNSLDIAAYNRYKARVSERNAFRLKGDMKKPTLSFARWLKEIRQF